MPKNKFIETAEIMWDYFEQYKKQVKNNPRFIYQLDKIGNLVPVPHEAPLTEIGFYEFVCEHPETKFNTDCPDLSDYFENKDNRYSAFVHICSRIKRSIKNDQITGGMVGQYNPSITQRLNGLRESTDVNLTSKPILNLDPLSDDSTNNGT